VLKEWVEAYERAWRSNDPAEIGALFADDALYYTTPYAEPWRGRDAIVAGWLGRKDEPGDATFEWSPLLETADASILVGTTVYRDPPQTYSNLWVIRFTPDSRCREFTEWWMLHPVTPP
jgi:hypothetical protein